MALQDLLIPVLNSLASRTEDLPPITKRAELLMKMVTSLTAWQFFANFSLRGS
ncbi:MAG TPA: hypothetical protein VEU53_07745 [Stellaceae bacterium]|nr:hypothetical protein [Stellaceae bacterium]